MFTFEPSNTRRQRVLVLASTIHPSLMKENPSKVDFTFCPLTALTIMPGTLSLLLRFLGLRKKSAPDVGAKFSLLSTTTRKGSRNTNLSEVNDMEAGKLVLSSVSTSRSKRSELMTPLGTFCTNSEYMILSVSRLVSTKLMSVLSALGLYIA